MQKQVLFWFILLALVQTTACTKDRTPVPVEKMPTPFQCDSTVTYTRYIVSVFSANCAYSGCHALPYPAAGINLSDYNDSRLQVENDNLIGVVKHEFGYAPMPYPLNSPPLPDSVIAIIQCWKDQGYIQ